jgi:SAM-dependent methyltransferase
MVAFGFDPLKTIYAIQGMPSYCRDLKALRSQRDSAREVFPFGLLHPCFGDRFAESGSARGHYFHQDLLIARRIHLNNPNVHVDVGSRVDGFVAHVASFRPINVIDIRPLSGNIPNVTFIQADLTLDIQKDLVNYADSISCLHALEHFGLGRYGDPINYDGYVLALTNLCRILKHNGKLYVSVPIGPQRIEFNAHRVFSVNYLLALFEGKYHIDQFSYVDDRGGLHEDIALNVDQCMEDFGCTYGCGILEMTKL